MTAERLDPIGITVDDRLTPEAFDRAAALVTAVGLGLTDDAFALVGEIVTDAHRDLPCPLGMVWQRQENAQRLASTILALAKLVEAQTLAAEIRLRALREAFPPAAVDILGEWLDPNACRPLTLAVARKAAFGDPHDA